MLVRTIPGSGAVSRGISHCPHKGTHCLMKGVVRASGPGKKGFGTEPTPTGQPQSLKVNDRGKVSSRPGNSGLKDSKKLQDAASPGSSSIYTSQDESSSGGSSPGSSEDQSSSKPSNRGVNIRGPEQSGWLTGKPAQNVETPQVVVDRIFSRMVTFSVAPVSLGIAFLGLFYYLKVGLKLEYPIWLVYISQVVTFGGGLLGITYGVVSASWDPTREGTFWGWTEFRANLPILLGSKGTK